jgi:hypothetical protein
VAPGVDYVVVVKGNQATLSDDIAYVFAALPRTPWSPGRSIGSNLVSGAS